MAGIAWIVAGGLVLAVIAFFLLAPRARRALLDSNFARARQDFHRRREYLEAKFFHLSAASGRPRGLQWTTCDFEDEVAYARDRTTGDLVAFVGVTIGFSAIEGGGMEEVEAVANLRVATAVFQYSGGQWRTGGRAIFNLEPAEAIRHFQKNLELVANDLPTRATS